MTLSGMPKSWNLSRRDFMESLRQAGRLLREAYPNLQEYFPHDEEIIRMAAQLGLPAPFGNGDPIVSAVFVEAYQHNSVVQVMKSRRLAWTHYRKCGDTPGRRVAA